MMNPAKKLCVYVRSGYQPRQDRVVQFFGRVLNRTEPFFRSKPGPLAGYPDPLLTLSRSASLCSPDHSVQVYLQIRTITTSKCISKLARSRPRSVSLSSLDRHFQAHLELLSSTACSQSRYTVCRMGVIG